MEFNIIIFIQMELDNETLLIEILRQLVDNIMLDSRPFVTLDLTEQYFTSHFSPQTTTHLHLEGT